MPILEEEEFAVINIADLFEPHGSRQFQGSRVGSKSPSIQPANTSALEHVKYFITKLSTQACLAKLFLDGDVLGPSGPLSELFLAIH
jgi:hypothetical protein